MTRAGKPTHPTSEAIGAEPKLPHERDETHEQPTAPPAGSRDIIRQAHDDIEAGQQDTDLHNQPGLEKPGQDGHKRREPNPS